MSSSNLSYFQPIFFFVSFIFLLNTLIQHDDDVYRGRFLVLYIFNCFCFLMSLLRSLTYSACTQTLSQQLVVCLRSEKRLYFSFNLFLFDADSTASNNQSFPSGLNLSNIKS